MEVVVAPYGPSARRRRVLTMREMRRAWAAPLRGRRGLTFLTEPLLPTPRVRALVRRPAFGVLAAGPAWGLARRWAPRTRRARGGRPPAAPAPSRRRRCRSRRQGRPGGRDAQGDDEPAGARSGRRTPSPTRSRRVDRAGQSTYLHGAVGPPSRHARRARLMIANNMSVLPTSTVFDTTTASRSPSRRAVVPRRVASRDSGGADGVPGRGVLDGDGRYAYVSQYTMLRQTFGGRASTPAPTRQPAWAPPSSTLFDAE